MAPVSAQGSWRRGPAALYLPASIRWIYDAPDRSATGAGVFRRVASSIATGVWVRLEAQRFSVGLPLGRERHTDGPAMERAHRNLRHGVRSFARYRKPARHGRPRQSVWASGVSLASRAFHDSRFLLCLRPSTGDPTAIRSMQ